MKKWLLAVTGLAIALLTGLSAERLDAADPQAGKVPEVSEIMQKLNKGKNAIHKSVGSDLKANPIDWAEVQKKTKVYEEYASAMPKNDPPKGEKASWEKLTKTFATNAKDLNTAAGKKDAAAALEAQAKNGKMCMSCHQAHRPQ
jgi:hypothetical protein